MKRVLDYNPHTGMTTYIETIEDKNVIGYSQDVEPTIELNKHLSQGLNKKEKYWYVGTIPDVLIMKWSIECGHKPYTKEWQEYAMKQLDNPDYRKFNQNNIRIGKPITWE